jgi:hypothetical protein
VAEAIVGDRNSVVLRRCIADATPSMLEYWYGSSLLRHVDDETDLTTKVRHERS